MDDQTSVSSVVDSRLSPSMPDTPEQPWGYAVKSQLRTQMGTMRKALSEEAKKARSGEICQRILQTPYYKRAHAVVGYVALGNEADPAEILDAAYLAGKSLGLPRVDKGSRRLSLHRWAPGDPLEKGGLGVQEPLASAPLFEPSEVDLIIVPALAIDLGGQRVGRGGGYYDRSLSAFPKAFAIGIIYDFQLIVEAPVNAGDVPVSAVATDRRLIIVDPTKANQL
jgi:5-formyltetrahydrofolate cyclo-ligase